MKENDKVWSTRGEVGLGFERFEGFEGFDEVAGNRLVGFADGLFDLGGYEIFWVNVLLGRLLSDGGGVVVEVMNVAEFT